MSPAEKRNVLKMKRESRTHSRIQLLLLQMAGNSVITFSAASPYLQRMSLLILWTFSMHACPFTPHAHDATCPDHAALHHVFYFLKLKLDTVMPHHTPHTQTRRSPQRYERICIRSMFIHVCIYIEHQCISDTVANAHMHMHTQTLCGSRRQKKFGKNARPSLSTPTSTSSSPVHIAAALSGRYGLIGFKRGPRWTLAETSDGRCMQLRRRRRPTTVHI